MTQLKKFKKTLFIKRNITSHKCVYQQAAKIAAKAQKAADKIARKAQKLADRIKRREV